jgi:hypothetical protein
MGGAKFERICRSGAFLMGVQSSRSNVPQDRPLALARAYYGERVHSRAASLDAKGAAIAKPNAPFPGGFRTAGPLPRDNQ